MNEADARLWHQLTQDEQQAAAEILHETAAAKAALVLATNAHAFADALIAAAPGPPRACAVGCAFCCYLPVTVEAPEPFAIVAFLEGNRTAEARAALRARLTERVSQRRGWTVGQRARSRWPCVFLDVATQRCTIYPVRPLACRGYRSYSRAACETAYTTQVEDPSVSTIDGQSWKATRAVRRGLRAAVRAARLDADSVELDSAVLAVWTRQDAAPRWRRGKRTYARADRL